MREVFHFNEAVHGIDKKIYFPHPQGGDDFQIAVFLLPTPLLSACRLFYARVRHTSFTIA